MIIISASQFQFEYLECVSMRCVDIQSADGVLSPVVESAEVERWRTPHSRINSC